MSDLDEFMPEPEKEEGKLQIAFLNLNPTSEEMQNLSCSRSIDEHCTSVVSIKPDSILDMFVKYLD